MKKIVTIGGGTGTFVVLSGLKREPDVDLTAIVSVADDGGSTGRLRDAYGYLPVGDLRQALIALSEEGATLRKLFSHRFEKGDIAGHNFGNLYLTALSEMLNSDRKALAEAAAVLKIKGRVIPVSDIPAILCAEYASGAVLEGQTEICAAREGRASIKRLFLKNPCHASREAIQAVEDANLVVLGPGDIYTSTLANFVTTGLSDAIARSHTKLVYVMNLFTTPESRKMTMKDYVDRVTRYATRTPDVVVVNTGKPTQAILAHYASEGQHPLVDNLDTFAIRENLLDQRSIVRHVADVVNRSLVRHDPQKLARIIMSL